MSRKITLTESKLHRIIKEAVKEILKEDNGGYIDSRYRWFAMRDGGFIYFKNSETGLLYAYNPQGNQWFGKTPSGEWVKNVAPDLYNISDWGSPHRVISICGLEPKQLAQSMAQVWSSNKDANMKQRDNQYQYGRSGGQSRDEELKKAAETIKRGYRPNNVSERDVDTLLRNGWVSPQEVKFVFGEMPNFYGGYGNYR